jgi:FXSXX-COOH protein
MKDASEDFSGDLIDTSGLSLRDVEDLPDSSLVLALREVMTTEGVGPFVAGFSARVLNRTHRGRSGLPARGVSAGNGTSVNVGVSSGT